MSLQLRPHKKVSLRGWVPIVYVTKTSEHFPDCFIRVNARQSTLPEVKTSRHLVGREFPRKVLPRLFPLTTFTDVHNKDAGYSVDHNLCLTQQDRET